MRRPRFLSCRLDESRPRRSTARRRGTRGARAPSPGRAGTARLQLSLVVDSGRARPLRVGRSGALGALRREPRPAARRGRAGGAGPRCDRPRPAGARRAGRGGRARRSRAPGRDRRGDAGASDRLLLRRVRRAPLAARLLRRAGRAGGRHPQGGFGSRAAARGGGADVPPGLLPPAHRRRRLAARVLGRHGSRARAGRARHGRGRGAGDGHRAAARDRGDRADLARRRRPRAAVPARHGPPRERQRRELDHLAALRRRHRRTARAVHPARRRRCARARRDGHRAGPVASQRGSRGVHLARGGARARRRVRRRHRRRAVQHDLHDPHARPGRQRHLSRRAGDRGARRPHGIDGARPDGGHPPRSHPARRRRRAVRRQPVRAAHEPRRERRQPTPRRGRARHVERPVARPCGCGRADRPRHQRRPPADVARRADAVAARSSPR